MNTKKLHLILLSFFTLNFQLKTVEREKFITIFFNNDEVKNLNKSVNDLVPKYFSDVKCQNVINDLYSVTFYLWSVMSFDTFKEILNKFSISRNYLEKSTFSLKLKSSSDAQNFIKEFDKKQFANVRRSIIFWGFENYCVNIEFSGKMHVTEFIKLLVTSGLMPYVKGVN